MKTSGHGVEVVVEQRHAERLRRRVEEARLGGDVLERAVARLRNSHDVVPRYASGVQYAFCLPSTLQKTSVSGVHLT